jgi:hypothetical protein
LHVASAEVILISPLFGFTQAWIVSVVVPCPCAVAIDGTPTATTTATTKSVCRYVANQLRIRIVNRTILFTISVGTLMACTDNRSWYPTTIAGH